jgi:ribosome recycling factor
MNPDQLINDAKERMEKALSHLKEELASVRTGRANPALLESLKVEAYGSKMDLRDVASINSPEPRLLVLQVWDQANITAVEKAIRESDLALSPVTENNIIRVPIPPLSEERRREMTKIVGEKSESTRVSIRQIRREVVEGVNKAEKKKQISEDEKFKTNEKVQKITERVTSEIDNLAKGKTNEILQI